MNISGSIRYPFRFGFGSDKTHNSKYHKIISIRYLCQVQIDSDSFLSDRIRFRFSGLVYLHNSTFFFFKHQLYFMFKVQLYKFYYDYQLFILFLLNRSVKTTYVILLWPNQLQNKVIHYDRQLLLNESKKLSFSFNIFTSSYIWKYFIYYNHKINFKFIKKIKYLRAGIPLV